MPSNQGPEETYVGMVRITIVSGRPRDNSTLLWVVRVPVGTPPTPGLLQQSYAIDPATQGDQVAALTGERNTKIVLQSMVDQQEGSASLDKHAVPPFIVIAVELVLKASTG